MAAVASAPTTACPALCPRWWHRGPASHREERGSICSLQAQAMKPPSPSCSSGSRHRSKVVSLIELTRARTHTPLQGHVLNCESQSEVAV